MKRYAFTMIELIFVIVVLGILASVALPKMGSTLRSGYIASAQGDVSAVRTAIASVRQKQLVKGKNEFIGKLSVAGTAAGEALFDGDGTHDLLTYPITAKAQGGWIRTGAQTYKFSIDSSDFTTFTYYPTASGTHKAGTFDCDHSKALCKKIVE